MDNPSEERRKHLRTYRNFILSYHRKDESAAAHEVSQVNNVSKGGLNFSSTQPLQQGELIAVDLKTPFLAASIRLQGVVLECKEKISGMIYEIRLQFQEVPPQVLDILGKIEDYGRDHQH